MTSIFVLLLASATVQTAGIDRAPPAPQMRKARDPMIAVQQELCAAREIRTVAAYTLFIARHPRHALAEIARSERDALVERNKRIKK